MTPNQAMKNLLLTSVTTCFTLFACQSTFAQNENLSEHQWCGNTPEYMKLQKQQDPGLEARMAKIESDMQVWIRNNANALKTQAVVTIPVVFHILWNTTAQNVSDTYINQQMDRLNKDYRKLNTDWTKTPSVFQPLVADCEIQFCLATKDPNGNPTNGIIHKQTTNTSFSQGSDNVKFSAQGGDDIWDRNKYLNIWVCNLGGISGVLGYGKPPGTAANVDGVVLKYTVLPLQDRIAVHEIGHWISPLYHPWYAGSCGSDSVADTPPQNGPSTGCPTFPRTDACSPSSPGIMFMNFMDYVNNNCMVMFTKDQKTRLQAGLNVARASLLTSSATNCGPVGINNLSLSDYISIYPNPSNGKFQISNFKFQVDNIEIYNVFGEKVYEAPSIKGVNNSLHQLADGGQTINLSSQPNGVYFLRFSVPSGQVKTDTESITQKLIIHQ